MNTLQAFCEIGQSVWLDLISRSLVRSGELAEKITLGLRGVGSPTAFQVAAAVRGPAAWVGVRAGAIITVTPEPIMLVIRARLDVRPDMRSDFLDAITDVIHDARHLDGVFSFDVCESITEPNVFISIEVYENDETRAQHRQSDIFSQALPVLESCLSKAAGGHVYQVSKAEPLES